jgi:hypothetical protein
LQPAIEDHIENKAIQLEDRLVNTKGLGCSDILLIAPGLNTVPDVVIHSIAKQADTLATPLKSEVVEQQNSSDEDRVTELVDLVMVEAASEPLEVLRKKSP